MKFVDNLLNTIGDMEKGNFGIVVSGGPAPGINGVINAAVIAATKHGYSVKGFQDGFRGVCTGQPDAIVDLPLEDVNRIYGTGGSILGLTRFDPFETEERKKTFLSALAKNNIDKLLIIGGDGSAYLSYLLHTQFPELSIAHIPKTIDNDLELPNQHPSFGFETARYVGTEILETLKTDARSTKRWFFVESMGRSAGFLALGLGVASGSPLTIIPEEYAGKKPSVEDLAAEIFNTIKIRTDLGKPYGVVILAEGLLDCLSPDKDPKLRDTPRDPLGRIVYSEISLGEVVLPSLKELCKKAGIQTRINTKNLGYELRCHKPVSFDIEYTRFLGLGAVEHLLAGLRGIMVTREFDRLGYVPLEKMLDKNGRIKSRTVDLESDFYRVAQSFMYR